MSAYRRTIESMPVSSVLGAFTVAADDINKKDKPEAVLLGSNPDNALIGYVIPASAVAKLEEAGYQIYEINRSDFAKHFKYWRDDIESNELYAITKLEDGEESGFIRADAPQEMLEIIGLGGQLKIKRPVPDERQPLLIG